MKHNTARLLALLAIVIALAAAFAGAWGSRVLAGAWGSQIQVEAASSVEAFDTADTAANLTW